MLYYACAGRVLNYCYKYKKKIIISVYFEVEKLKFFVLQENKP